MDPCITCRNAYGYALLHNKFKWLTSIKNNLEKKLKKIPIFTIRQPHKYTQWRLHMSIYTTTLLKVNVTKSIKTWTITLFNLLQAIKWKGMKIVRNDFRLISEWILHEFSVVRYMWQFIWGFFLEMSTSNDWSNFCMSFVKEWHHYEIKRKTIETHHNICITIKPKKHHNYINTIYW